MLNARVAGTLLALAAALLAPTALASELLINGVPIGRLELRVQGIQGLQFDGCTTVKIGKNGSVDVSCPGYDLKAASPKGQQPAPSVTAAGAAGAPGAAPAVLTKRYWAVPEQNVRGGTRYDIDLYVNAKWIRRFKMDEDPVALEITRYLQPGSNRLLFASTRRPGAGEPADPAAYFRLVIGEGEVGGGRVVIDQPLFEVRRTAGESENFTEERQLTTR